MEKISPIFGEKVAKTKTIVPNIYNKAQFESQNIYIKPLLKPKNTYRKPCFKAAFQGEKNKKNALVKK
jgi:hypothetical protein